MSTRIRKDTIILILLIHLHLSQISLKLTLKIQYTKHKVSHNLYYQNYVFDNINKHQKCQQEIFLNKYTSSITKVLQLKIIVPYIYIYIY